MRAIFFGTPEISVPALEALHEIAEVTLVVCQPDRPAGRGLQPRTPAVKARAVELGIAVEQPTKVKTAELAERIRAERADVALVMAYGRILPKAILDAPRLGCINLHASILPKYRGAAPITWAIVHGESKTGVSLMQMDEGMDTGPIFTISEVPIGPDMDAAELSGSLATCAASLVRSALPEVVAGRLTAMPQDQAGATHARMLEKEDGRIDWSESAARVHDHVRGMTPWPGAFTSLDGKTLKILSTRRCDVEAGAAPGTVAMAHRGRIEVACAHGRVEVVRAQLEGRKPLNASELVGGRTLSQGMTLGAMTITRQEP